MTTAAGGFSPYILFRRGTLGLPALSGIVPVHTWSLLDDAEAAALDREMLRGRTADELHRAIPDLPAEQRRELLRIRRDVHNDRPVKLSSVVELLPEHCRALLREWSCSRETRAELTAETEATFTAELETARKTLAEVALHEDFRRGVQLSGEEVYREVMAYASNPFDRGRKPSRRRRAESTIISFACRVVFKPSPFGSFTEIGAQPWSVPTSGRPTSGRPPSARTAQTRINIGLLAWMAHQLHRIERSDEILRVRMNNTLMIHGDRAVFVRRPIEGAENISLEERVVSARNTDLVRLLVEVLGGRDLSERELRGRLVAAGLSGEAAATTIDQLVKVGLCHRGFGLPDQTTGSAGVVATLLRKLDTAQAATCAAIFERTQGIEKEYATAATERRTGLLAELHDLVHRLAEVCAVTAPPKNALNAVMYEDLGTRGSAWNWQPSLLENNRRNFELFQRLLPVLDEATIERLGLYRFFTERFGSRDVGLIDFYRAFADLSPEATGEVMSGSGDPFCARVRELRRTFFEEPLARLAADPGCAEFTIDPNRLGDFVDSLPDTVAAWRSAAYRIQISETDQHRLAVVNGVTTGHGVFFSRFCDLLEPAEDDEWNIRKELRSHIASTSPRQTDITATLGLNFNLHPRLTPYELVYPGSVPRAGAENVLTLADLVVRANPRLRRLELVSASDGRSVDLVPLNFLFPAASPVLYRFLCAFAPTRTYRGGLWEQFDRAGGPAAGTGRPRVLLGDLVLDRRSWRFDIADLPALDGLERQELTAMASFDRWRRSNGVPRHTFFRLLSRREPQGHGHGQGQGQGRDLAEETKRWALEARSARLHKPHYLDMRNPFLLYVLAKHARTTAKDSVIFQECLPSPDGYTDHGGPTSAEEFFVEFDMEGSRNVDG